MSENVQTLLFLILTIINILLTYYTCFYDFSGYQFYLNEVDMNAVYLYFLLSIYLSIYLSI